MRRYPEFDIAVFTGTHCFICNKDKIIAEIGVRRALSRGPHSGGHATQPPKPKLFDLGGVEDNRNQDRFETSEVST